MSGSVNKVLKNYDNLRILSNYRIYLLLTYLAIFSLHFHNINVMKFKTILIMPKFNGIINISLHYANLKNDICLK